MFSLKGRGTETSSERSSFLNYPNRNQQKNLGELSGGGLMAGTVSFSETFITLKKKMVLAQLSEHQEI